MIQMFAALSLPLPDCAAAKMEGEQQAKLAKDGVASGGNFKMQTTATTTRKIDSDGKTIRSCPVELTAAPNRQRFPQAHDSTLLTYCTLFCTEMQRSDHEQPLFRNLRPSQPEGLRGGRVLGLDIRDFSTFADANCKMHPPTTVPLTTVNWILALCPATERMERRSG
ncbi:hypothetical protein BCV70DRAFT_11538 [Testicularia cyperi]|uniref:Uncharacterized protein n=1 Tax=Testicularia cyperi TaxID=1882483 RepID=A0A317Y0L6_9BASI|nr:hypothetical protein BCV70DRAFT_11538 [Testicularia cyperi]